MNKYYLILLGLVLTVGILIWGRFNQKSQIEKTGNGELVSASDLHWHPHIKIFVKGEERVIPANIGIGAAYVSDPQYNSIMGMTEIHTHDDSGKIHLEMAGPVTKDEIRTSNFLWIWGRKFPGTARLTVNGLEIKEADFYLMQDNDQIEIKYE